MNVGESFRGRSFARRHPQGGQDNRTSSQPIQSTAPTFSSDRVRRNRQKAPRRARRQRVYLLDPVCLHAVCSSINEFGSRTRRRRYKIRTPARNLSSKLLNPARADSDSPQTPVLNQPSTSALVSGRTKGYVGSHCITYDEN